MKLDSIGVSRLLVLLLSCVMALAGCSTGGGGKTDQRYFTWVDEFGRVRQSPINEEENAVEQRAAQVQAGKAEPAGSSAEGPAIADASTPAHTAAQSEKAGSDRRITPHTPSSDMARASVGAEAEFLETAVVEKQAAEPTRMATANDVSDDTPDSASPEPPAASKTAPEVGINVSRYEPSVGQVGMAEPQAETTASPKEASGVDEPVTATQKTGEINSKPAPKQAQDDESEYTLENYPDGNELAKQGFIREGDPLPYFTWRDAQGNVRVDYYRPEAGFDKPREDRGVPALTSAVVIDGSRQPMIEQANADALEVLGIDKTESLLDAWVRQCCQHLPKKDLAEWDDSREFQLGFDDLAPEFQFSTGNSVYRLVELPEAGNSAAFVMQVRSYVKQGVFLPSLAFLDEDMATRRLVTELAFEYQPESWHSHGYLEARVPVFPRQGDRWLLIMSRAEDQAGQTVFETEEGTTVIRHAGHGLLGLAQMGD